MNRDLMHIYLDDHAAAATGAIEFARRCQKNNADNAFGRAMRRTIADFEAFHEALHAVLDALELEPSATKEAAAWLMEKLGRLKLNGRIVSYSPLSRLVEIEGLMLAAHGARSVFYALRHFDGERDRALLGDVDFEALIARADEQIARLQSLHERAVTKALDPRDEAAAE